MASLSSSRPAEVRLRLKLGLAVVAGLGQGTLALGAVPAAAQSEGPGQPARVEAPRPAEGERAPDPAQDDDADDAPAASPFGIAPELVPVPDSLDALIPESALANPEGWAAAGVEGNPAAAARPQDEALAAGVVPPADPAVDAVFADLAVENPAPLPSDPEAEALAAIDLPVIGGLPELAETRIDGTLVLALPADPDAFPEKEEFVERFRDLSTLRALDTSGPEAIPQVAARARADEELLGDILRTYGYYDGEVVRQLSGGRREGLGTDAAAVPATTNATANATANGSAAEAASREASVRFDIIPGPRYRFGQINLGALPTLREPDATNLVGVFGIRTGDPLYADRIVDQELNLRVALGESGYPFAELGEPSLLIDHAREEGDLTLDVQPKGKYVFGPVVSGDPRFLSSRHLGRIARFEPGEVYQKSLETDLRRAILATGLVSSVTLTPRETRAPQGDQPGEVALDVGIERAPLRTIAGAIGYGSEDGFKVEGRWEHRNLFPPEGALRLRGIIGTREALASVGVRRNNFRGRDQILSADLYASDINTLSVDSRGFGLRMAFEKVSNILFQKPVSFQVGGELLYTDERNLNRRARDANVPLPPRQAYLVGGLFGSVTLDASDDLLDPRKGWRTTLFVAPEVSRTQGAQSYYLRAQADASYYQPVGGVVVAARARAATIQGTDIANVAPSRRLYAGGGGSVRGYGFQGVGPRDEVGNPTGGASLVEFALEARIPTPLFGGSVEVVPFIDAGSVARGSTPDFGDIRYGAGIGLRYKTSFGPIRIDVAAPLNKTAFDSPVVVYVSLGQAF
ncbi:BamA/TamA family outer membrane protein [Erythrobacter sp. WG]|uniref:BamA/TamA family outer membrane protein n=1 Tax=Erythrobacter sp. WG TaxID=2985510 RepID=UPI00226FE325|nr:BamA/TamA family outer membrane protein [Erythrobacter sp. WG]MCX9147735.1 BamA/TamA family outer membrane protein [Erythrobacter sp. WG]